MDDDFAINTVARAIQYVAVVENLVEVPDDYTRTQELANLWIAALVEVDNDSPEAPPQENEGMAGWQR